MNHLRAFFQDKQAQLEWAEFVKAILDDEALKRVYAGKDTSALKEARDIIDRSFKELKDLCTPKEKKRTVDRAV
jgi:hypothetical protein